MIPPRPLGAAPDVGSALRRKDWTAYAEKGADARAIGIAARTGHPVGFWQFTRYGVGVTVVSTVMAWAYVALRYF